MTDLAYLSYNNNTQQTEKYLPQTLGSKLTWVTCRGRWILGEAVNSGECIPGSFYFLLSIDPRDAPSHGSRQERLQQIFQKRPPPWKWRSRRENLFPLPLPFPTHTRLRLISGHAAAALVSGWKNWQGGPREQEHIPGRGTGRRESPMCVGCVCLRQTQSRSDCSENESKTETTKSNSVHEIPAQPQRSQQRIRTEVGSAAYQREAVVFGLNLGCLSAVKT